MRKIKKINEFAGSKPVSWYYQLRSYDDDDYTGEFYILDPIENENGQFDEFDYDWEDVKNGLEHRSLELFKAAKEYMQSYDPNGVFEIVKMTEEFID